MNTHKGAKSGLEDQMVGLAGLTTAMPICASLSMNLLVKLAPAWLFIKDWGHRADDES